MIKNVSLLIVLFLCVSQNLLAATVNAGAGALSQSRVKWAHQLGSKEGESISLSVVFGDWDAESIVAQYRDFR